MGFYVRAERVRDTSADHALGHPSKVGQVRYSKTFRTQALAQREADAWSGVGPYAGAGPSDWIADVHEGRAPRKVG